MVQSRRPGGDCGCASREREGGAGLATSALPLSGPASARDGERRAPGPGPPLFCLRDLGLGEMRLCSGEALGRGMQGVWGHPEAGRKRAGRGRGEEGASGGRPCKKQALLLHSLVFEAGGGY